MADSKRKCRLIPFLPTDRGCIEAWMNRKARKGWQFIESHFFFFAIFQYVPIGGNNQIVYRLKNASRNGSGNTCRRVAGWHMHSNQIMGYEIWSKETENPYEWCPNAEAQDIAESKRYNSALLADLAFGVALLLEASSSAQKNGGVFWMQAGKTRCIVSAVLGLAIVIHSILRRRNIEEEPGCFLQFLSSILSPVIIIGAAADIILLLFNLS